MGSPSHPKYRYTERKNYCEQMRESPYSNVKSDPGQGTEKRAEEHILTIRVTTFSTGSLRVCVQKKLIGCRSRGHFLLYRGF